MCGDEVDGRTAEAADPRSLAGPGPRRSNGHTSVEDTYGRHNAGARQAPPRVGNHGHCLVACGDDGGSLNAVVLPDLTPLFTLIPGANYGPSVLAPDAAAAYFGVGDGYLKVRVSDGAILEHVPLLGAPQQLYLLPDGQTLIATINATVIAVDLR